jgi:hypothetical protein
LNRTTGGNVKISANPDTCATFDATGHLIPQIDVGLSALGGIVSTSVFLNLDASADFSLYNSTTSTQQCVSASTNLDASVGAKGSFFNIFDASVGTSLFDKDFPLFQVRARSYVTIYPCIFLNLPTTLNSDRNALRMRIQVQRLPNLPTQRSHDTMLPRHDTQQVLENHFALFMPRALTRAALRFIFYANMDYIA